MCSVEGLLSPVFFFAAVLLEIKKARSIRFRKDGIQQQERILVEPRSRNLVVREWLTGPVGLDGVGIKQGKACPCRLSREIPRTHIERWRGGAEDTLRPPLPPFLSEEKEGLVAIFIVQAGNHEGSAYAVAEVIVPQRRSGRREIVPGVQHVITQIFISRAVEFLRA